MAILYGSGDVDAAQHGQPLHFNRFETQSGGFAVGLHKRGENDVTLWHAQLMSMLISAVCNVGQAIPQYTTTHKQLTRSFVDAYPCQIEFEVDVHDSFNNPHLHV